MLILFHMNYFVVGIGAAVVVVFKMVNNFFWYNFFSHPWPAKQGSRISRVRQSGKSFVLLWLKDSSSYLHLFVQALKIADLLFYFLYIYFLCNAGHFQVALNLCHSKVSAKPLIRTSKFKFMRKVLHLALFWKGVREFDEGLLTVLKKRGDH